MEYNSSPSLRGSSIEDQSDVCSVELPSSIASASRFPPASCVSSVLSIGIGSYTPVETEKWVHAEDSGEETSGARWPDIEASLSEAALFADTAREHLTSRVQEIPVRDGQGFNYVSRKQLFRSVNTWVNKMRDGTTHLFFYAGHGYEFDGEFFLVPADSDRVDDDLKLSSIRHWIDKQRKNCRVLFFIAACREYPPEEPERGNPPRYEHECEKFLERYHKADLRQNNYLQFFACRPDETVEAAGDCACGPFVRSLTKYLADKSLSVIEIVDKVRADVVEATSNKEQPCIGFQSLSNFYLYEQDLPASEYSHGLAGPRFSPVVVVPDSPPLEDGYNQSRAEGCTFQSHIPDGHKQWRKRINRLTIHSNISKPCIVLVTDTAGKSHADAVSHFVDTGMGPHYVIHKNGHITQLVEEHLAAWCGNPGFWGGLADRAEIPGGGYVNEVHYFAVSIALEGDGDTELFDPEQYTALVVKLKEVTQRYDIQPSNVLGLSEICMPPGKFKAPGQHFNWGQLIDAGLALEAPSSIAPTSHGTDQDLRKLMETWGYCLGNRDKEADFRHRLQSFCDRYQKPSGESPRSFALHALENLLVQRGGR